MGRALATNTGIGWMDLWGEGWLDDEGFWERIGEFTDRLARQQREADLAPSAVPRCRACWWMKRACCTFKKANCSSAN